MIIIRLREAERSCTSISFSEISVGYKDDSLIFTLNWNNRFLTVSLSLTLCCVFWCFYRDFTLWWASSDPGIIWDCNTIISTHWWDFLTKFSSGTEILSEEEKSVGKDLRGRMCRKWTHVLNTAQGNGVRVICAKIPPQDGAPPNVFNAESSFFFSFFLFLKIPALLCHIHLCFLPLTIHFLPLFSRIQLFLQRRPPQTKWLILSRNAFRVNRKLQ